MRLSSGLLAATLGVAAPAGALLAQVAGLPVRNAGIGTGIGIAGDLGLPNAAAGKGFALGLTGVAGFGPLGVSGSVAWWDPQGSAASIKSIGATGNLKIFGGPLIPLSVSLQAGAAYGRQVENYADAGDICTCTWHVPIGVGVAVTVPNPVFSIKPWVAPRLDILRTSTDYSTSSTRKKFAISGGVDVGFLNGQSIRLMYDRVMAGNGVHPSVLSLGLGFRVGK